MKTRTAATAIIMASAIFFAGCGEKEPETPEEIKKETKKDMVEATNSLPEWIVDAKVEDTISAIGIAGYSKHGIQVMLPQAEVDGRAKLAGKIQTITSQLKEKSMRHTKINDIDEFETAFKEVTKEVIKNMPVSGARRINMHQAEDGTLYVHMVIEKNYIAKSINDMKNSYKQHMENAKISRQNLDEGMAVLDKMVEELDKEINN